VQILESGGRSWSSWLLLDGCLLRVNARLEKRAGGPAVLVRNHTKIKEHGGPPFWFRSPPYHSVSMLDEQAEVGVAEFANIPFSFK